MYQNYYLNKSYGNGQYQAVDYIKNISGGYIDTGFKPNSNTRVVTCMSWYTAATNNFAFGSGDSYNSNNIELYSNGSQFEVHYSGNAFIGSYSPGQFFNFDQDKGNIVITNEDGTANSTYNFGTKTFNCNYTLHIFALHRSSNLTCSYSQACKYFDVYDNGVCIRKLKACYDKNSSDIGLYDVLNKKFYPIKGSTNNSYGKSISNVIFI